MIFNSYLKESDENVDLDAIDAMTTDPDSPDGIEQAAAEVEDLMRVAALESCSYFENGEVAVNNFLESNETKAFTEARKMSKNTYVRLNRNDDYTRRAHLASLVLAKKNNDPLWNKLALNRVKERRLREAIFKKYGTKAAKVAKVSQRQHIAAMRKLPALPMIKM